MTKKDCAQFIIHKIENGWRLEYRDLGNVHPSTDYPDDESMLEGIKSIIGCSEFLEDGPDEGDAVAADMI